MTRATTAFFRLGDGDGLNDLVNPLGVAEDHDLNRFLGSVHSILTLGLLDFLHLTSPWVPLL